MPVPDRHRGACRSGHQPHRTRRLPSTAGDPESGWRGLSPTRASQAPAVFPPEDGGRPTVSRQSVRTNRGEPALPTGVHPSGSQCPWPTGGLPQGTSATGRPNATTSPRTRRGVDQGDLVGELLALIFTSSTFLRRPCPAPQAQPREVDGGRHLRAGREAVRPRSRGCALRSGMRFAGLRLGEASGLNC